MNTTNRPPLVSFLMLTYGRASIQPAVLNEAVYWCLNQDYPKVEVVVVNDNPDQKLWCKDPRVNCVNLTARCPDLGTKCNKGLSHAHGLIVLHNDDDDISLPWRAKQAVDHLQDPYHYWSPKFWFYEQKGMPVVPDNKGCGHNCAAYRRFYMHHPVAGCEFDQAARAWAYENVKVNERGLTDPKDISFVYRWGVSHAHLSGYGDRANEMYKTMPCGAPGRYEIVPAMQKDYVKACNEVTGRKV